MPQDNCLVLDIIIYENSKQYLLQTMPSYEKEKLLTRRNLASKEHLELHHHITSRIG
jgi:hypothetical protein